MTEQEKRKNVIKGLECCNSLHNDSIVKCATDCPYWEFDAKCRGFVMRDALALLKRSFTPQEVYDTVIEHAQHDMRFKLGDKIDYSFADAVDILNIELMCKAGDM